MNSDTNETIFAIEYYISGIYDKGWSSNWIKDVNQKRMTTWLANKIHDHHRYRDFVYYRVKEDMEKHGVQICIRNKQIMIILNL